jgi:3-deoxy-D-manno-octulosonic-acid transferase
MPLLYTISIYLYTLLIRLAALFNPKAKKWIGGRRHQFEKLASAIKPEDKTIWVHSASLGEFEQGRPVIEALKERYPGHQILLTFFSPSGYEVRKNYDKADHVFYLPADTPADVKRFLTIVKPVIVVFIKYEYWFNYIRLLHRKGIPMIVISAIFRPGQRFFRWWGKWQLNMLRLITHFFVQNESSAQLLKSNGIGQVTVSGDTRFDRVFQIARQQKPFPLIEQFCDGNHVLVAGSTWPPDEEIIISYLHKQPEKIKVIIAPHEVAPSRIESLLNKIPGKALRFSEATAENISSVNVLVVDSIGILSRLYRYADVAYIGGGFGVGIHNILEAATFGKPVIFGPNYKKFQEAVELIKAGGAFSISSAEEFNAITDKLLSDDSFRQTSSGISKNYVENKKGAASVIIKYIENNLMK